MITMNMLEMPIEKQQSKKACVQRGLAFIGILNQ
jgi:hypothetical protein